VKLRPGRLLSLPSVDPSSAPRAVASESLDVGPLRDGGRELFRQEVEQAVGVVRDAQVGELVAGDEVLLGQVREEGEERAVEALGVEQAERLGPSRPAVQSSKSSSRVPSPPGRATMASASSAIRAFLWCIVSTTSRRVRPACPTSRSSRKRGITPTTSPPASRQASATAFITPTRPPP